MTPQGPIEKTSRGTGRIRRFSKRSRSGCILCKKRKKKCDEKKPKCTSCTRLGTHCEWPAAMPDRDRSSSPYSLLPNTIDTSAIEVHPMSFDQRFSDSLPLDHYLGYRAPSTSDHTHASSLNSLVPSSPSLLLHGAFDHFEESIDRFNDAVSPLTAAASSGSPQQLSQMLRMLMDSPPAEDTQDTATDNKSTAFDKTLTTYRPSASLQFVPSTSTELYDVETDFLSFWVSHVVPSNSVVEASKSAFLVYIMPMMSYSPAIRSTVFAWAATQRYHFFNDPNDQTLAEHYSNDALTRLRAINPTQMNKSDIDTSIAAALLYCGVESMGGLDHFWPEALSIAKSIIDTYGGELAFAKSESPSRLWLVRNLFYHDVLSAITCNTVPHISDVSLLIAESCLFGVPLSKRNLTREARNRRMSVATQSSSSSSESNSSVHGPKLPNPALDMNVPTTGDDDVFEPMPESRELEKLRKISRDLSASDALMAYSQGIFCILWRVARLAYENFTFPESMFVIFTDIRRQIETWQPSSTEFASSFELVYFAEVYRAAARLALYVTIMRHTDNLAKMYQDPLRKTFTSEEIDQNIFKITDLSYDLHSLSPPEAGIVFPLFIAGCLARDHHTRHRIILRLSRRKAETGIANSIPAIRIISRIGEIREEYPEKKEEFWASEWDWVSVMTELNVRPIMS
ncbi:hypothetical protein CANCADRAFT_56882 [Tortispora caseinolytica NRRL Y-17796]|uniref:Zn(2)-C6 fungal-type domain-containing protein n=1 Tax=Tortispora caseinolytica NRRL Y-17796 TaxID=767744 RepID=A0A1E4TF09_9ASCO|nr:hypothetical protein CANCADRAFT_56882 [Tortispora caseinolytica NRRL Y-17796]